MEEIKNCGITPEEYCIQTIAKKYGISEELAQSLYNDIFESVKTQSYEIDKFCGVLGQYDRLKQIDALSIRKKQIEDVKEIVERASVSYLFSYDENGNLKYDPDYFLKGDNLKNYLDEEKEIYYDVFAGDCGEFVFDATSITEEQYNMLKSVDFDINVYNALLKENLLNAVKKYRGEDASINMDDVIPLDIRVNYTWDIKSSEDRYWYCHYEPLKYYVGGEYCISADIKASIGDNIIYELEDLRKKYGYSAYIDSVINTAREASRNVKTPNITRDEMFILIEKYINENNINDSVRYSDVLCTISTEEDKEHVKEVLRRKYNREQSEKAVYRM